MKNKEILFEFKNDWQQIIGKWNWYSFTFIQFYVEHEKWLRAISLEFTILGIGVYIRFNYDVESLNKKLSDWEAEELNETE